MFYLGRRYYFKLFKDCLQQILLGPFFNTLKHMMAQIRSCINNDSNTFLQFIELLRSSVSKNYPRIDLVNW